MFLAALILILSTAMLLFFFQVSCQRILRRSFDREYFRPVVNAYHFEFVALRQSLEEAGTVADYYRLRGMLEDDFHAMTYLLKHAANVDQRYSNEDRLLIWYSRWLFLSLTVRHFLSLGEKQTVLRLTSVLQYFANELGQRINAVRFGPEFHF